MPDLGFHIENAEPLPHAASPQILFKLRIDNAEAEQPVHSVILRCQIQIEATRRRYDDLEKERLFDLFGPPGDWDRTLRNMPWTEVNVNVPGFTESTVVDLPIPCTYDFNVAATRYFDALEEGEVPLCLLFSGTVFHAGARTPLQVAQIPWETEAKFRMPARLWRDMMDRYYPDRLWLPLPKELFERIEEYQRRSAAPTWERALEMLLNQAQTLESQTTAK